MNAGPSALRQVLASVRPHTLALPILVAAAWIATHRYQGIWHDGVLYAGQAVFRLDPGPFSRDLFFAYGSQDGFTLFTAIYALAIEKLGLPVASTLLLATAHVAWLAAAAFLLRAFLAGLAFWLALILVAMLPGGYGSGGVLAYGESFLTARIWAEPAALLAVACILRGYRILAVGSLLFAAAMHPIIAFPAALFVLFFALRGFRQSLLGLGVLAVAVLLACAAIPSLSALAQGMDPLWQGLSRARSPFVFLDLWQANEFREPLFLGLLLSTAALAAGEESRRLWWSALGVLCAGMGLAFMAIHWPAVLVVQMQPWRVLWLAKILAIAAAMVLARDAWSTSAYGRILVAALLACALAVDGTGLLAAVPLLLLLVAARRLAIEPRRLPAGLVWSAWAVIALLIGERIFSAAQLSFLPLDFAAADFARLSVGDRLAMVLRDAAWFVFPPLLVGAWLLIVHCPRSRPWLALVLAGSLLFIAGHWRQGGVNRVAEDQLQVGGHAELARIIQAHHLTYWGDGLRNLWLVLHRGSYASASQAAGAIFSRQTAVEAERRLARVRPLGLADSIFERVPTAPAQSSKRPTTVDDLVHACHDPILDFVVLLQPVPGATPMTVVSLYPSGPDYRVYACAPLRAVPDPFPAQR